MIDPLFQVQLITATPSPQQCIWVAMHQDYSEQFVASDRSSWPDEQRAGDICVQRLLAGERGHYGPLEHVQIALATGYFPHSVMQQARTHRIGTSFDVQSGRYTSLRILQAATRERPLEEVFYVRPAGSYSDRQGKKYSYGEDIRKIDLARCYDAAGHYAWQLRCGMSEEHARGMLPFDYRQHFVVSFTLRSFLHFLDLRAKRDAQLEIQQLCELMLPHLDAWVPQIAAWYRKTRLGKARLSP
jgi:thymidylate synthase (FAD)